MRPKTFTNSVYVDAFAELAARIARSLEKVPKKLLPIKMYVAGGTALHFYTGSRVSVDVDAAFSRRIAVPDNLEVSYRESDGAARLLYFDKQYSDTLGLMHEDAYDESISLSLKGVNSKVLDIRLLTPLDLAVSKLGRFAEQDREDIAELAKRRLITAKALRKRAEAALVAYVGDTLRLQGSIDFACRLLDRNADARAKRKSATSKKMS